MNINLEKLREVFSKDESIMLVYLYGSYVSNRMNKQSDVDFAVLIDEKGRDLFDLRIKLINLLKDVSRFENIDLVILNEASPLLAYQIVKSGKVIYSKSDIIPYIFKAKIFGVYLDIRPVLDKFTEKILAKY